MQFTFYRYRLTLGKPALALLIVGASMLSSLGYWQLSRGAQKASQVAAWQAADAKGPVALSHVTTASELHPYQQITASGHFDNAHHFLRDNKTYQGRAGYHVLTPFIIEGMKAHLLVDRGWIPLGTSRHTLPQIPDITDTIQLTGKISFPTKQTFTLGGQNIEDQRWPSRVQSVKIPELVNRLEHDLFPGILILSESSPYGFQFNDIAVYLTPSRHRGYALQWFLLAATWVLLIVMANTRKDT